MKDLWEILMNFAASDRALIKNQNDSKQMSSEHNMAAVIMNSLQP